MPDRCPLFTNWPMVCPEHKVKMTDAHLGPEDTYICKPGYDSYLARRKEMGYEDPADETMRSGGE